MQFKEDIVETEVIGVDNRGRAYGEYNDKKIFVKYGVPGDYVKIRIYPIRKGRRKVELWGDIIEIIEPGEGRIEPRCKHFGRCGGCRFQNWRYEDQLKYKRNIVIDSFKRFDIEADVEEPIPSPKIWFYRNRMDFPVGRYEDKPIIGLKEYGRWDVIVGLDECYLMSQDAVKIIHIVRDFMEEYDIKPYDIIKHKGFLRYVVIREGKNTGDRLINLVSGKGGFIGLDILVERLKDLSTGIVWSINPKLTDLSIGEEVLGIYGKDYLTEEIDGLKFYIHPNAFFQTNSYQANKLTKIAKEYSSGGKILLDVYSGVGLFSYILRDKYEKVVSIEVDKYSVYSAEINKKWINADNVSIVEARAEEWLSRINYKPDTIIVDPPRPGLSKSVKEFILKLHPKEILYFSCNPETMARDINILSKDYRIDGKIITIDMFPHTPHIEAFARLIPK